MGKYYVYDGNLWFKEFKDKEAVLTNRSDEAMAFDYKVMADSVAAEMAQRYGGTWAVFDPWETLAETDAAERLLRAIFSEDGENDG